jgi:ABC-type glycerol-3-phosphate transport system permease component
VVLRVRPGVGFVNKLPLVPDDKAWFGERGSSFIVIIAAEVWKTTPFMALLLLAGLTTIDEGLYEAARVDGASAWQRFVRITLPLMKPAIAVALLFRTLDAFRVFDSIFVMTRGAQDTQSVSILGYDQLISRLNLGLGSAVSVLIFLMVLVDRVLLREDPRRQHPRQGRSVGDAAEHTQSRRLFWTGRLTLVVVAALRPGRLAADAVAQDAGHRRRRAVHPEGVHLRELRGAVQGGLTESPFLQPLINSILIALIATTIAITLAAFTAYAIARLDFPGKSIILAGALAIAMFPPISVVGPLFDMWRALGIYDTYPGLIIPYLTFALRWRSTRSSRSSGDPVRARAGRPGRRRDADAGLPQGHPPLAAPGMFTAAILVFIFCWNDFLFAITLTSSSEGARPSRGARLLHGRVAVHRADGRDRRRGDPRHHPDHPLRPVLPAPDRGRPHLWRRQGLGRSFTWLRSCSTASPKRYPDGFEAVKQMDLTSRRRVHDPRRPVGCGKSTALRMIAGLEDISDGELRIDGEVVNGKAPKDRDIAMVFQSYALYPHMTVRDNMGFALKLAKVDQGEIDRKVEEAARSSTSPSTSTASRRTCRAASASASRWAARSCATRRPT